MDKIIKIGFMIVFVMFISACNSATDEFNISFESNGGSIVEGVLVEDGNSFLAPTNPTKEGYIFNGWYSDSLFNDSYDFTSPVAGDINLFADWDAVQRTISFDSDGGNLVESVTYYFGASVESPAVPIKEGFDFLGWYQITDLTELFVFDTMPSTHIELIALWRDDDAILIAMITDSGGIDDGSFNQSAWEGIVEFAVSNNLPYSYYKPTSVSDEAYLDAIALAIDGGAEIVITPGFLFETSLYVAQTLYPDIKFVLIDGMPHNGAGSTVPIWFTSTNTKSILFKENEAGFLAGYAAVKDGYYNLGFTGGIAVPAVVKFGIGFVAGAYYAAEEDGVTIDFNDDTYQYFGNFSASDTNKNIATSWYANGTEVIFCVAGGAGASVMAAAEDSDKMMIGVDVDQSANSSTVLTSAMKNFSNAAQDALQEYVDGTFTGGLTELKGIINGGVALPMATSRFTTFTQNDYDAIYAMLVAGTVAVPSDYAGLVAFLDNATLDIPSQETIEQTSN